MLPSSIFHPVFQNMAASVIASSLGTSPSPSAGTVESNYADATAASPIKLPSKTGTTIQTQQQKPSQQQQQLQTMPQQQQQQQKPALSKEDSTLSNGGEFSFPPFAFHSVDHRLSLYFDLVLFGDEEEFVSILCADVVASGKPAMKDG